MLGFGLFFFGAKKLPELSKSLGQALVEFKKGVSGAPDEPREVSQAVDPPAAGSSATDTAASKP